MVYPWHLRKAQNLEDRAADWAAWLAEWIPDWRAEADTHKWRHTISYCSLIRRRNLFYSVYNVQSVIKLIVDLIYYT